MKYDMPHRHATGQGYVALAALASDGGCGQCDAGCGQCGDIPAPPAPTKAHAANPPSLPPPHVDHDAPLACFTLTLVHEGAVVLDLRGGGV